MRTADKELEMKIQELDLAMAEMREAVSKAVSQAPRREEIKTYEPNNQSLEVKYF